MTSVATRREKPGRKDPPAPAFTSGIPGQVISNADPRVKYVWASSRKDGAFGSVTYYQATLGAEVVMASENGPRPRGIPATDAGHFEYMDTILVAIPKERAAQVARDGDGVSVGNTGWREQMRRLRLAKGTDLDALRGLNVRGADGEPFIFEQNETSDEVAYDVRERQE